MIYDVAVVGLGPAGVTACVQLKRCGFSVVGIEAERIGGTLHDASLIENLPVLKEGANAATLIENLEKNIARYNIEVIFERVSKITRNNNIFVLECERNEIMASAVIIAIGLVPKKSLAVDDMRIFYRIRDVGDVQGRNVGIIGLGDAGFDAALQFAGKGGTIYLLGRSGIKAIPELVERVRNNSGIKIFTHVRIAHIETGEKIILHASNVRQGSIPLVLDKILMCTGKVRDLGILPAEIAKKIGRKRLIHGMICKGMYAAGDFADPSCRYVSSALGSGMKAATLVAEYLRDPDGSNRKKRN
ncbi:MAG: NAD(P)/FAD-dependent oxidoreductase [Thermoplasmata archaeon]